MQLPYLRKHLLKEPEFYRSLAAGFRPETVRVSPAPAARSSTRLPQENTHAPHPVWPVAFVQMTPALNYTGLMVESIRVFQHSAGFGSALLREYLAESRQ